MKSQCIQDGLSGCKKYHIFGYSDYIKNSLNDIIDLDNVYYYECFEGCNYKERIIHRLFVSRYSHLFSGLIMPVWKNKYWLNRKPKKTDDIVLILYEINPLSNKIQWIRSVRNEFPNAKIVYIFTNIIDEHRMWRVNQIASNRELFDLVLTFNKSDADKYEMTHYEGVFSAKVINPKLIQEAEQCDVYFCGLDKGRLVFLKEIYDYLTSHGIKCIFDIIYPEDNGIEETDGFRYHKELINNDEMLANVNKAKCILEVMVDRTQPGSSLRMCESIAYKKKLLTNNSYITEKPFFNEKQMKYFDKPEDIDIKYILNDIDESDYLPKDLLSPTKLLEFIEGHLDEVVQD